MPFWDKLESAWNFTGEDYKIGVGSDKSHAYMKSKNAVIYVSSGNKNQRVVAFKPFIESFSIDFDMKFHEKEEVWNGKKFINPIKAACVYKLKLKIPSHSINEARMNKRKLELFRTFVTIKSLYDASGNLLTDGGIYKPQVHYFLFSNLIQNGTFFPGAYPNFDDLGNEAETFTAFSQIALQGIFKEINYNVVAEDGFYEYKGFLFPKTYETNLSFIPFNQQKNQENDALSNYLWDGYTNIDGRSGLLTDPAGVEDGSGLRSGWPFGLALGESGGALEDNSVPRNLLYSEAPRGEGFEKKYSDGKGANIYIFPSSNKASFLSAEDADMICLSFKPFVNSLTYKRAYSKEEVFDSHYRTEFYGFPANDAETTISFDVVCYSVQHAKTNHAKMQELFRFLSPATKETDSASWKGTFEDNTGDLFVAIYFNNLIYDERNFRDNDRPGDNRTKLSDSNQFDFKKFYNRAKPFFLTKVAYSPDFNMGVFDDEGMLFPKVFKIDLTLKENYTNQEKIIIYNQERST